MHLSMVPIQENAIQPPRIRTKMFNIYWGHVFRQIGLLTLIIFLSIGSYMLINRCFLGSIQIVGKSMAPTLPENSRYILNRWKLRDYVPKVSDIVVIKDPEDHELSVKRIVAVEGQCVHFKDGKVFVDGKELDEPYLRRGTHTYTYAQKHEQLILCGKNQVFVLGDNRTESVDSRAYGPVTRESIQGLVMVR
jgi:signal peptidase I